MSPIKTKINVVLMSAMEAVANLCEDEFSKLNSRSEMQALAVSSQVRQGSIDSKSAVFYRSFLPLRGDMVTLLADTYRQYFKLALAHASETRQDANLWAWIQLQPAIHAAIAWIGDWYVLACEGENRHLVTLPRFRSFLDSQPRRRSISQPSILRRHHPGKLLLGYLEFL